MDRLDQDGGGTDLLQTPQIDVAMKVYRGGGEREFLGLTGKVQRHQVSLYNLPSERVGLKVYKGGGMETEAKFRGMGLKSFQENPSIYKLLQKTGKYALKSVESRVKGNTEEELKAELDKMNVFFYGEGKLNYTTQLLLFSTVLEPKTKFADGSRGLESSSQVAGIDESGKGSAAGTIGILILEVGEGWSLYVPEDIKEIGEEATTILIGPYWVRDPNELTAESFFKNITASELIYINDIMIKDYPLRFLMHILKEKKEEFFTKVWKPMVENHILSDIEFQLDASVRAGREFLENVLEEQVQYLRDSLERARGEGDEGAEGEGESEAEGDDEVKGEGDAKGEPEGEVKEEGEVKGEGEPEAEVKGKGEGEPDAEVKGEPEDEVKGEAEAEGCESLRTIKTKDPLIEYLQSLYILLDDTNLHDIQYDLKELKRLKTAINKKGPKSKLTDNVNRNKEIFIQTLGTYIESLTPEQMSTRGAKSRSNKDISKLENILDNLKDDICAAYLDISKLGPLVPPRSKGGRRTRRKPTSSV